MYAETLFRCPGCFSEQWGSTIDLQHGVGVLCRCGMGMEPTGSERYDEEFAEYSNDRDHERTNRGEHW